MPKAMSEPIEVEWTLQIRNATDFCEPTRPLKRGFPSPNAYSGGTFEVVTSHKELLACMISCRSHRLRKGKITLPTLL